MSQLQSQLQSNRIQEAAGIINLEGQPPTLECQCCLQSAAADNFFQHDDPAQEQYHRVCYFCLRTYIKEAIGSRVLTIQCPSCDRALTDLELDSVASPHDMARLKRFRRELELRQQQLLRQCPGPGCENFIKVEPGKQVCQCAQCGTMVCVPCSRPEHQGRTCDQVFKEELKQLNEEATTCPRCRMAVVKSEGCNHMTCVYCSHQFCWLCRATYSPAHFLPFNPLGCPGLQDSTQSRGRWHCCKIISLRVLVLVGVLVGIGPALVLAMLLGGPFLVYAFCYQQMDREDLTCGNYLSILGLGLVINPLVWVVGALAALPFLAYLLVSYVAWTLQLRRETREALRQRLLSEEDSRGQTQSY